MHYRSFTACNFGPFRKFSVELTRGLIGIFGPNGAGKTSFLDALYAMPYNDFSRFPMLKADLINDQAGAKDGSYIEVEIAHEENVFSLTRSLKPKSNSLSVNGGARITDDLKITAELERLLGVDKNMLSKFVFKRQNEIYDFISSTDAIRKKAFQVLCQTEQCEEIYEMFGEFLNRDSDLNTRIIDNSDELISRISEARQQIGELEADRETQAEDLLDASRKTDLEAILKKNERHAALRVDLRKAKKMLKVAAELEIRMQDNFDRRARKTQQMRKRVSRGKEEARSADAALRTWKNYAIRLRQRKAVTEEAERLAAEARNNPEPPPAPAFDVKVYTKKQEQLSRTLRSAKAYLADLDQKGLAACPTCGTPVKELAQELERCREIVRDYPARIKESISEFTRFDEALGEVNKYTAWKERFSVRVQSNEREMQSFGDLEAPAGDAAVLEGVLRDFATLEASLEASVALSEKWSTALAAASARVESAQDRISDLRDDLEKNKVSDDDEAAARDDLERHNAATSRVAKIDGRLEGVVANLEAMKEDLDKLRARLKRTKRLRKMGAIVAKSREVVHRNNLPNAVAMKNLNRMEGDINEGLGFFGDPFWVEGAADLTFTVHMPGHPSFPAARLSTGQRVTLAVPFWLAAASLWKNKIGMLALDEPTANLDADNRTYLANALGHLNVKVKGSRQIIMVTHDVALKPCFDQVIELG